MSSDRSKVVPTSRTELGFSDASKRTRQLDKMGGLALVAEFVGVDILKASNVFHDVRYVARGRNIQSRFSGDDNRTSATGLQLLTEDHSRNRLGADATRHTTMQPAMAPRPYGN